MYTIWSYKTVKNVFHNTCVQDIRVTRHHTPKPQDMMRHDDKTYVSQDTYPKTTRHDNKTYVHKTPSLTVTIHVDKTCVSQDTPRKTLK